MADPTNLDLWQLATGAGPANLDLGASPDAEALLNGVVNTTSGFPVGGISCAIVLPSSVDPEAPLSSLGGTYTLVLPTTVDALSSPSVGGLESRLMLLGAINCTSSNTLPTPLHAGLILRGSLASSSEPGGKFSNMGLVDLNVYRDPSGLTGAVWAKSTKPPEGATFTRDSISTGWDGGVRHFEDKGVLIQDGASVHAAVDHLSGSLERIRVTQQGRYEEASHLSLGYGVYNNKLARGHWSNRYEQWESESHQLDFGWWHYGKMARAHPVHRDRFTAVLGLFERTIRDTVGRGAQLWYENKSWYEEAGYPAHGRTPRPVVPPKPPVVIPTNLNLRVGDDGTNNLEFYHGDFYEECLTIPPQKVYVVMNEVRLFRVSTNEELPLMNMSLGIDVDSWAWGFKLSLPYESLPLLQPEAGAVQELDLHVNGTVFRVLAEKVGTRREFNRKTLDVSGRGLSAYLAKPYAEVQTFTSEVDMTAQQLMNQVLTANNVSIGWEVDWGITDWIVPAGVWSVRGTYIDAVKSIASAAGAFVLPDPFEKKLYIRPQYPILPWNWGAATPDYQVPDHVVQQESVEWVERPSYNAVYVTGRTQGVLAYVRRGGTPANLFAPMVTDALVTDAAVARMRGESILAETGLMAEVSVSLPILPEVGIIMPGKLFQYVDGGVAKMGVTTGVSLSQRNGSPVLRQEVEVTHHG